MAQGAAVRKGSLADLRARLAARPDTEHEQGILRLVISSLVFLYLLPDALPFRISWPMSGWRRITSHSAASSLSGLSRI